MDLWLVFIFIVAQTEVCWVSFWICLSHFDEVLCGVGQRQNWNRRRSLLLVRFDFCLLLCSSDLLLLIKAMRAVKPVSANRVRKTCLTSIADVWCVNNVNTSFSSLLTCETPPSAISLVDNGLCYLVFLLQLVFWLQMRHHLHHCRLQSGSYSGSPGFHSGPIGSKTCNWVQY